MLDEPYQAIGQSIQGIENRGQVHPCRGDGIVDILDIPEKYVRLCKEKPQADAEQVKLQNHQREQQRRPVEFRAGDQHDDNQRSQRKHKIHHAAGDSRHGENIPGHIGLFQQGGVAGDGENRLMGGAVHKVKQKLSAEQIHREILDIPAEHGREHNAHNNHNEQRVQDTPHITQHTAAVFQLQVLYHQQLQQVFVLDEFFNHSHGVTPQLKSWLRRRRL